MEKLCCDICGGTLIMQSGGKVAICDSCGMQYSVERIREKVQEIKGTVSIEGTVKTQDADFIIRGGVLERYNGNDVHVIIPDSVVEIDKEAFARCVGIQSIIFPSSVKRVGTSAFCGCESLDGIKLPDEIEEIGNNAFLGCRSLKQIDLPESLVLIGKWAFSMTGITSITIPSHVTRIGDGAFFECKALTEVSLPDGLKEIGNRAFYNCTRLEVINIPDQVEGGKRKLENTFGFCTALQKIVISEKQKERLFVGKGYQDALIPVRDIFEEKIENDYADDDGYTTEYSYSDKNCGSWYLKFKRELEEENQRKTQERRRLEGKCQHCGGAFSGLFTKRCTKCGKYKDY